MVGDLEAALEGAGGDATMQERVLLVPAGDLLRFEKSAISWEKNTPPTVGQRLSYELDASNDRQPRAMNLQTV